MRVWISWCVDRYSWVLTLRSLVLEFALWFDLWTTVNAQNASLSFGVYSFLVWRSAWVFISSVMILEIQLLLFHKGSNIVIVFFPLIDPSKNLIQRNKLNSTLFHLEQFVLSLKEFNFGQHGIELPQSYTESLSLPKLH